MTSQKADFAKFLADFRLLSPTVALAQNINSLANQFYSCQLFFTKAKLLHSKQ